MKKLICIFSMLWITAFGGGTYVGSTSNVWPNYYHKTESDIRFGAKILSTNVNYTSTVNDSVVVMLSANALTNTLPTNSAAGTRYTVKRYGTNNVHVKSAWMIDNTNDYRLGQNYQSITVISDGARWHVIGGN